MTYIDYMNRFWKVNEEAPFSARETQLYFFLLEVCNRHHWKMPFNCPTCRVVNTIAFTRQTLVLVRQRLKECEMIDFVEGEGNRAAPSYTLLAMSTDKTNNLTIIKNNKNKDNTNLIIGKDELLELEELKGLLLADNIWLENVKTYLFQGEFQSNIDLSKWLSSFFAYLKANGTIHKGLEDSKRHFVNWLMKQTDKPIHKSVVKKPSNVCVVLTDDNKNKFKDIKGW
ncbi:hypothetical protein [Bacteroides helcogenes]|uniref:DUF7833 domain-containing protein n=2 Tax=Bacteroides helcogenes TaxID=290053 RepID=E6SWF7_BACT6|nr:hypothetical protein [Bacteroides helcogenes]ADV44618.1 hypothetical protein Bache_2667 [Bacteroides helcogenes P 36-108]